MALKRPLKSLKSTFVKPAETLHVISFLPQYKIFSHTYTYAYLSAWEKVWLFHTHDNIKISPAWEDFPLWKLKVNDSDITIAGITQFISSELLLLKYTRNSFDSILMFMLMLRVVAQLYLFCEVVIEHGNRPISIKDWNYIHFIT